MTQIEFWDCSIDVIRLDMIRSDIIDVWSDLIGSDNINVRSIPIRSNISDIGLDLVGFKICDIRSNPIRSDFIDVGFDLIGSDGVLDHQFPTDRIW